MKKALTPSPKLENKAMTMSFYDAIRSIVLGNRIARISWANSDYCVVKDGFLCIHTKGELHTWKVSDGDIDGEDWIVVTELN